jgi:hypothetical protein
MIGESVMTPPRIFMLLARLRSLVRRFAATPHSTSREEGIPKPFPFFGD